MTNDEILSKTISYLRFPLTVGVVFIHFDLARGLVIRGTKHGLDNPDWYFYIIRFISEVIAEIGVPLFFIISGYLFFYRKDFNGRVYKQKLRSRIKTLLIPFILWNLIAIMLIFLKQLPGISSFYQPVEIHLSVIRIFNTFFWNTTDNGIFVGPPRINPILIVAPIDGPLWYVRDLMLMVILSPVVYWLIKKMGVWYVVTLFFVWFFCPSSLLPTLYDNGQWITASFFFSFGAFFSVNKENFVLSFRKLKMIPVLFIIVAIADVFTKTMEYNGYIHKVGIVFGIVSAVVVVSYLLEYEKIKVNPDLANSSFFIFALHSLFIGDVGKLAFTILHIPENNPCAMLTLYFLVPIFSIIVCLKLYFLSKRYTPKVCDLLTGGR